MIQGLALGFAAPETLLYQCPGIQNVREACLKAHTQQNPSSSICSDWDTCYYCPGHASFKVLKKLIQSSGLYCGTLSPSKWRGSSWSLFHIGCSDRSLYPQERAPPCCPGCAGPLRTSIFSRLPGDRHRKPNLAPPATPFLSSTLTVFLRMASFSLEILIHLIRSQPSSASSFLSWYNYHHYHHHLYSLWRHYVACFIYIMPYNIYNILILIYNIINIQWYIIQ